ncbi:hypothetical protein QFC22_003888 [Naganishia vaughanmartiniae]|uniref:Uncharacterized protein n=1 Tax=Naganishia vaughanmartiniae TaxID=1424756 RepID=A0ACC2X4L9_9TREE|nr:hypothetical protein QFC22_003888 [Naganishia vaughanmartiniae]
MSKDTKPSVAHSHTVDDDFNWSLEADWLPVEKKIGNFLIAIDKWAADQKHTLKETGVQHHQSIKTMEETKVDIEREIEEEREKERILSPPGTNSTLDPLYPELEEEREHHANLQRYNQELQVAVNRASEQQTSLDSELNKLRHEMMALKIDKQRQKKVLVEQKELDGPEVERLEYLLGWRIEAVKRKYISLPFTDSLLLQHSDLTKVISLRLISLATTIWNRFTQIDPNDPEREFSLLIDFSDGDRYAGTPPPRLPLGPPLGRPTRSMLTPHFACTYCSSEMFAPVERVAGPCLAAE